MPVRTQFDLRRIDAAGEPLYLSALAPFARGIVSCCICAIVAKSDLARAEKSSWFIPNRARKSHEHHTKPGDTVCPKHPRHPQRRAARRGVDAFGRAVHLRAGSSTRKAPSITSPWMSPLCEMRMSSSERCALSSFAEAAVQHSRADPIPVQIGTRVARRTKPARGTLPRCAQTIATLEISWLPDLGSNQGPTD